MHVKYLPPVAGVLAGLLLFAIGIVSIVTHEQISPWSFTFLAFAYLMMSIAGLISLIAANR